MVFTSVESTLAALKEAGNLANSLGARITLVVPQVVPYPAPSRNAAGPGGVQREPLSGDGKRKPGGDERTNLSCAAIASKRWPAVLKPGSIVVVGGRKRWWPTKDEIWPGNSGAQVTKCFSRKRSKGEIRCSIYFT